MVPATEAFWEKFFPPNVCGFEKDPKGLVGQRPLLIYVVYNYINYNIDTINWVLCKTPASYWVLPTSISSHYLEKVERMVLCILFHSNCLH